MTKLYWGIALLMIASPIGLVAKEPTWGEWSRGEIKRMVDFMQESSESEDTGDNT